MGGIFMRKNDKNKQIICKLMKELNIYDIIIMIFFKKFTCKVYRKGINDAFYWENQKYGKKSKNENR